jgi:hypothetical protein
MSPDELQFFDGRPGALGLYERLRAGVLALAPEASIVVRRTQITFRLRYGFAFASFTPVKRAAERGPSWLTVSFGLPCPVESPRVIPVEVRPNRWTCHVLVNDPGQLDGELFGWIAEAADFGRRP